MDHLADFLEEKDIEEGNIPDPAKAREASRTASVHKEDKGTHAKETAVNAEVQEGYGGPSSKKNEKEENRREV